MNTPNAPKPPQPRIIHWIDVRDHLPDDEITVLVSFDGGEVSLGWHEAGVWRECACACQLETVTHWMDLPEPPEDA